VFGGELGEDDADAGAIAGELFGQGAQVFHTVPMEFVQVEDQAVFAAGEGVSQFLGEFFGVSGGEGAFEPHPDLFFGLLPFDLDGKVGGMFFLKFLPQIVGAAVFLGEAVGGAL